MTPPRPPPVAGTPPPCQSGATSENTEKDVVAIARDIIRWLLTMGAAIAFAVFIGRVCGDVWVGTDPVDVDSVLAAVTISLSITLGSAFVGWFGVTVSGGKVTFGEGRGKTAGRLLHALIFTLPGSALVAMLLYLAGGAVAGLTYVFNQAESPTVVVTVATAWAAQASGVIASTLATALKPP